MPREPYFTFGYDGGQFGSPSDYAVYYRNDGCSSIGLPPSHGKILVRCYRDAEALAKLLNDSAAILMPVKEVEL